MAKKVGRPHRVHQVIFRENERPPFRCRVPTCKMGFYNEFWQGERDGWHFVPEPVGVPPGALGETSPPPGAEAEPGTGTGLTHLTGRNAGESEVSTPPSPPTDATPEGGDQ